MTDHPTYGIIPLSLAPVRAEASDRAELVTQALFGTCVQVLVQNQQWLQVRLLDDGYEGWIDRKQLSPIDEQTYQTYQKEEKVLVGELFALAAPVDSSRGAIILPIGSRLPRYEAQKFELGTTPYTTSTEIIKGPYEEAKLVHWTLSFLGAPYLWGGKSILGIDCSGFTQLIYTLCGINLPRDAHQQAEKGEVLAFISEAKKGDLAFFDNEEGRIIHVGIILEEKTIIHAHGEVRIDRLDHIGIFNVSEQRYTHKLRLVKRVF